MRVNFFDDPAKAPKPREEVRLRRIGLYIYPDKRRVAVGFELTPFLEGPSLEVTIRNNLDQQAASLNVIETNQQNFSLTMHLRDAQPTEQYHLRVILYYAKPGEERLIADEQVADFMVSQPGEHIIYQTG